MKTPPVPTSTASKQTSPLGVPQRSPSQVPLLHVYDISVPNGLQYSMTPFIHPETSFGVQDGVANETVTVKSPLPVDDAKSATT